MTDLTAEFSSGGYIVRPLDHLSFSGGDGELIVLVGPSGSGKTTLLSCLAALLTPTAGSIRVGDIDVGALSGAHRDRYRRETVGIVFQAFNLIPSLTAIGNVMAPLRLAGVPRSQAVDKATQLLARVGLADRHRHRPGQLSGGQQQRVAIARALVHDPPLVLADEPTAHLDHIQVEDTLGLLRELARPGRLVLVATHDDRVRQLADRVVELAPELAVTGVPPRVVDLEPGQLLFQQGDRSDLIYVIEAGKIEILRRRSDGTDELVRLLGPGRYFGELGPMLNLPRSASARAASPCRVRGYTVADFRRRFKRPTGPAFGSGSRG